MNLLNYHQLSLIRQTNDGSTWPKQHYNIWQIFVKLQATIELHACYTACYTLVSGHENCANTP